MNPVMVRCRFKPDRVAENEARVRDVYEELEQTTPEGLRQAAFVLEDGVSFVHFASVEGETNPLPQTAAFKRFQAELGDRCTGR